MESQQRHYRYRPLMRLRVVLHSPRGERTERTLDKEGLFHLQMALGTQEVDLGGVKHEATLDDKCKLQAVHCVGRNHIKRTHVRICVQPVGKEYKFIPYKVPVGFVQVIVKILCITPNHYARTK